MSLTWQGDPDPGTHPAAEELAEYADGGMETRHAEQIAAHLRACAACRAEAASYGPMLDMLRALPQHPAPRSFGLDELAGRRDARPSAWPAWASLAASVVLAFGMIAALLDSGVGGGTASLTSTGAGDAAYAPAAANQESGGAATGAGADTEETGEESVESASAPDRAAEEGVADSVDAAAAPAEPASAEARSVSATAATGVGAVEESDGEDEPTLAAASVTQPTAGTAAESAEGDPAVGTPAAYATHSERASAARRPSATPSAPDALLPSGAPTLAAAGAPDATGAAAIAQAAPPESARDATREAEARSAGANVLLGLTLGALSAVALGVAVALFRRVRSA